MLLIILLLSFLIFVYVLVRLIVPLRVSGKIKALAALALLLTSQQHVLIRLTAGNIASPELPAPLLLISGWIFVSLLFLFLLLLLQDVLLFARWLFKLARQRVESSVSPAFSPGRRQAIVTALAVIPATYGVRQGVVAPDIRQREVWLPGLPKELDGLTLVQITDLHVSPLLTQPRVREIVDRVNAVEPDLICFTGDVADGTPEHRAADVAPLKDLRARYGVFGCTGNHEYYSDYPGWMRTFPKLGITMLHNSHVVLNVRGKELILAGIPDIAALGYSLPGPDIAQALAGAPEGAPRILMDHRPVNAFHNAKAGVDLQLSGHTHGGQILGMNQLVARFNSGFVYGWYQVDNMRMYVSSGAGLWSGFPVRLGVPSEVVRFVLRIVA